MTNRERMPLEQVPPATLLPHRRSRHLDKPLKDLEVQVEATGVGYGAARAHATESDHALRPVRPLYETVRRQAAGWVDVFRPMWPWGDVRVYVELCHRVCLVGSSVPSEAAAEDRNGFEASELSDPAAAGIDLANSAHAAWLCLRLGAARLRNQRPRQTGRVRTRFQFRPSDVADWPAFDELLETAEEVRRGYHLGTGYAEDLEHLERQVWLADLFAAHPRARDAVRRCAAAVGSAGGAGPTASDEVLAVTALNAAVTDPAAFTTPAPWLKSFTHHAWCAAPSAAAVPRRERERVLRAALEALFVSRHAPIGRLPDQVLVAATLQPFVSRRLVAVPIFYPKTARLLGMVTVDRGRAVPRFVRAVEAVRRLVDGMIAVTLNTELALLEATYRIGQTDFPEAVVEVALHLARKYVGANDCCVRILSPDGKKVFSCKSDCQHQHREFGPRAPQSREKRLLEVGGVGTVYDNMTHDRDGEIIGHLLRDERHVAAVKEVHIPPDEFIDNSALLGKVPIGQNRGIIVALHHIATNFYGPADFVLLKAILRPAEQRIAELAARQAAETQQERSNRIGHSTAELNLTVRKQELLETERDRVAELWRAHGPPGCDLVALCGSDFERVLVIYHGDERRDALRADPAFRAAARKETDGFDYPRYLWVPKGQRWVYVDTSYDLTDNGTGWAVSEHKLEANVDVAAAVIAAPVPGHDIGRIWVERRFPAGGSASPFTPEQMKGVDTFLQKVASLLEAAWGEYVASEAWRSDLARITSHNVGHVFGHAQMTLADLQDHGDDPARRAALVDHLRNQLGAIQSMTQRITRTSRDTTPSRTRVSRLVRSLEAMLAGYAAQEGIRVTWDVVGEDATVSVDREMMEEVVRELFINAAHEVRDQPDRTFAVEVHTTSETVRFLFQDNGPGIDPWRRERVFDSGYSTKTQNGGGRGLGLMAARRYVQLNHGRLRVIPPPGGRGACFEMTLPNFR